MVEGLATVVKSTSEVDQTEVEFKDWWFCASDISWLSPGHTLLREEFLKNARDMFELSRFKLIKTLLWGLFLNEFYWSPTRTKDAVSWRFWQSQEGENVRKALFKNKHLMSLIKFVWRHCLRFGRLINSWDILWELCIDSCDRANCVNSVGSIQVVFE